MDTLLMVLGLVLVLAVGLGALVVAALVRAARAASAKAERVALRARSLAGPGSTTGRIASVRLGLRNSLESTRRVLEAAHQEDGQLADAMALLKRLDRYGAEVDADLRQLEREPDAARAADRLGAFEERAERVRAAADQLRWATQDRAHRLADDELTRLGAECAQEAEALRHWQRGALPREA
ncbi:hypothetical protein [Streptacidiphilus monticola]|uniref:Secreted protein n=1 Tax=Streptacidiphilus monticola TaxID=2161674 RepID=A0ABW1FUL1_9ACTN